MARMRAKEVSAASQGLLSPNVIIELLYNLRRPLTRAFFECRLAIFAAAEHCNVLGPSGERQLTMIGDSEANVCSCLFGLVPPENDAITRQITRVVSIIDAFPTTFLFRDHVYGSIRGLSKHHASMEEQFVDDFKGMLKALDPTLTEWRIFFTNAQRRKKFLNFLSSSAFLQAMAEATVSKHAEMVGITLTPQQKTAAETASQNAFAIAYEFYRQIVETFVHAAVKIDNPKKKFANNVVDYLLCLLCAGQGQCLEQDLVLVSSEKKMRSAAKKTGNPNAIISLKEYLIGSLGFLPVELPPALQRLS